jgi:hypothetical protein
MATAHTPRGSRKTKPPSSLKPEPQPQPTPTAETAPPSKGLLSDWVALLLWVGGVGIMAALVLFDTLAALFRSP